MKDLRQDIPLELDEAFKALGRAVSVFWPLAAKRIEDVAPQEHADMAEFLARGGTMRMVVHFAPRPAVALEFTDHDGKAVELYRFEGRAGSERRVLN